MIAEVIPIKRLPRRFTHFDYTVPVQLEQLIIPGQLVSIPLKSSEIFGLVLSIKNKENTCTPTLKSITEIINNTPILSKYQLNQLLTLSYLYGVSNGTIAKMILLPLQKRKIKSINLEAITQKNKPIIGRQSFKIYNNEKEHILALKKEIDKFPDNQIAIMVPEINQIDEIICSLQEYKDDIIVWHSSLSIKEQFKHWIQIRNGEKKIIIGTRGAILLPYFNLKQIIIDYEHKNNHKHWDQSPRFHVKDIAELLRTKQNVNIVLMSYSPSVETYFNVHKKKYSPNSSLELTKFSNFQIANLSNEYRGGNYSPISEKLEQELIKQEGNSFLHINRLGIATYIGCCACDWRAICDNCKLPQILHEKNRKLTCNYCKTTNPLPIVCKKCNGNTVRFGGIGTETVEKYIKEFIKKNKITHDVIRIDSQTSTNALKTSGDKIIIIGTDTAFSHIDWDKTSLIALLDIDKNMAIPEFRSQEELWHTIKDIQYKKRDEAILLIQTRSTKNLIIKSLKEPDRFYRTDLNHRMKFGYTPYKYLVRYFYGHANLKEAKTVIETSVEILSKRLQEAKKDIILSPAFDMYPKYYRGRYWFGVLAKLDVDAWQEDLLWLNSHIPATWKIDPNPINVLSP